MHPLCLIADTVVPVANRRAPRASRSALTSDGAARAGGACLNSGRSNNVFSRVVIRCIHLKTYTGLGSQLSFAGMARSWALRHGQLRTCTARFYSYEPLTDAPASSSANQTAPQHMSPTNRPHAAGSVCRCRTHPCRHG